jgi:hypothetical protein
MTRPTPPATPGTSPAVGPPVVRAGEAPAGGSDFAAPAVGRSVVADARRGGWVR